MSWQTTKERGSLLGMRIVVVCLRRFGLWPARCMVEFIVFYFFLTGRAARRASRDYLERVAATERGRAALGGEPTLWTTWLHFRTFGQMLLDRVAFWIGEHDRFRITHTEDARGAANDASKRGVVFVGAHFGNVDALRALSANKGMRISPVIFGAAPKVGALLREIAPELEKRVIRLEPGSIESVLALKERVENGESVALLGDRAELVDARRTVRVEFLGSPANFPVGPLHIAALLRCPVYFFVGRRTGRNAYEVSAEKLAESLELSPRRRAAQMRLWIESYAARLEENCQRAPLQWFNFYDFWASARADGEEQHVESN